MSSLESTLGIHLAPFRLRAARIVVAAVLCLGEEAAADPPDEPPSAEPPAADGGPAADEQATSPPSSAGQHDAGKAATVDGDRTEQPRAAAPPALPHQDEPVPPGTSARAEPEPPRQITPPIAPTEAMVHVAVDYPGAWLETRSVVDGGPWQRVCPAPCDRKLKVDGMELRVRAPKMTTSNAFRIDAGSGTARLGVSGGSAAARTAGLVALGTGLPIAFGGMTLFGLGSLNEDDGLRTGGIVGLAVGAAAVLASLPLLLTGGTNVRNDKGKYIAQKRHLLAF